MAQFRYFSIPHNVKVMLSAVIHEDQIPRDDNGKFVVRLAEVHVASTEDSVEPTKKSGTGTVMFGGKHNPNECAAKIQLQKLLDAGFLPNNIVLVPNAKREGWYSLRVWLDTDPMSSRRSFADWGLAGEFALDVISQKWSFVMVYDNGDSWSFNMSGRTLDDRHSTYFGLVPKVIGQVAETPKVVAPAKPKAEVAPKPAPKKVAVLLGGAPSTALSQALIRALGDSVVS